jgi:hypothetical protein
VTSDGYDPGDLDDPDDPDDPFVAGWWVGADGNWHTPQESFSARVPREPHMLRRVVVVLLAVAIVVATTVSVLAGSGSLTFTPSSGPSLAELTSQVQQAVSGSGSGELRIGGVTGVKCHAPSSWSVGAPFSCDVFGSGHVKVGQYDGTVQPTSPSGEWQWQGRWTPSRPYSVS